MRYLLPIVFFFQLNFVQGQNLIVNPGAELDPPTNGWTVVTGGLVNPWEAATVSTNSPTPPHSGTYYFYAGNDSPNNSELYQDIDVSAFAASIDAGSSTFTFSAWMRIFNFNNDKGKALVEYRDASSTVLSTFDTGWKTNYLSWQQFSDVRIAPAGTRTIRIRLIAAKVTGTAADGYFDDLVLTHTSTFLPVSLISFTSTIVDNAVDLKWQTATEEANSHFTLERSIDGVNWSVISTQAGAVNSTQTSSYQFIDKQLANDVVYYRLTQTDIDGTSTTYPVITQRINLSEKDFTLYPNPSAGEVTILTAANGEKKLKVFSVEGKLLRELTFEGNEFKVDLSGLSAGHYIIEVLTLDSVKRKVLVRY